jgi:hypothetical protein
MICEKLDSVIDLVSLSLCSKRLNYICKDVTYIKGVYDIGNVEKNIALALEFNKNIKLKLDLSDTKIFDVSMLGKVHNLNLSWCKNITDVSNLGNVHTLDLKCCKNIKDVSMLGRVHRLNLSYCDDITDVSNL